MNELKNKILTQIKEGEIKPTSRFYFVTRDYFFWLCTGLSVVVGSLAVASILHLVVIEHLEALRGFEGEEGFFSNFMEGLPFIWIIVFIALLASAWFNYKHTTRSYRYHNALVVVAVLATSLVVGVALFTAGAGKFIDERGREHLPYFQQDHERRETLREEFLELRRELREKGIELQKPKLREGAARIFREV